MRQKSLLSYTKPDLSSVMPSLKACLRRVASDSEGLGRKALLDEINSLAKYSEVRLTGGNSKVVGIDTLDKWLSPSDANNPPSILALLAFCIASNDYSPLDVLLNFVGLEVMTAEDRKYRDIGKAGVELEQARKKLKQAKEKI